MWPEYALNAPGNFSMDGLRQPFSRPLGVRADQGNQGNAKQPTIKKATISVALFISGHVLQHVNVFFIGDA
jgi:hypothetical protein